MKIDGSGRPSPPPLYDLLDLLGHGRGVTVHPPGRKQRLQVPLLALPLGILRGQQPIAKRATNLAIEDILLRRISHWCSNRVFARSVNHSTARSPAEATRPRSPAPRPAHRAEPPGRPEPPHGWAVCRCQML